MDVRSQAAGPRPLRRRRSSIDSNPGWGSSVGECLVASGSPQYGGAGRPGLSLFGVKQLGSFDAISPIPSATETLHDSE